ncbi:hypothetical protein SAMN05216205_1228 [Pseudomonas mohnii]|uniref:Uncharacterized protein n=1 Tax=Pseudomonas mohnii TaxID=395600 RepID=A0ABY0XRW2_9PSED|nr:hypothetical protein [Pseudomonas mohnii]SEC01160.1 hypothetical protein SAMN05216205_1228 [Pseudomonas mohnii]
MDKPKNAEEMRALLLSQHPNLKDDLAKISDFELLQLMICAYECAIGIKEAEMGEMARALFSPMLH